MDPKEGADPGAADGKPGGINHVVGWGTGGQVGDLSSVADRKVERSMSAWKKWDRSAPGPAGAKEPDNWVLW